MKNARAKYPVQLRRLLASVAMLPLASLCTAMPALAGGVTFHESPMPTAIRPQPAAVNSQQQQACVEQLMFEMKEALKGCEAASSTCEATAGCPMCRAAVIASFQEQKSRCG